MENKEEWQELNQWAENKKAEKIEKYGIDISYQDLQEKNRNIDNMQKVLKPIGKTMKVIFVLVILSIIILVVSMIDVNFSNLKSADIDSIDEQYSIKTEIISKDIDKNENGKYILGVKTCKNIQFTAIRENKKLLEDFKANYQKYIFNSWNNPIKEKFEVAQTVNEKGLLSYQNYIIVNETTELETVTEYLIEFLEYAEKWNKENKVVKVWQQKQGQFIVPIEIYIKVKEKIIYPYNAMFQTKEEIRQEARKGEI